MSRTADDLIVHFNKQAMILTLALRRGILSPEEYSCLEREVESFWKGENGIAKAWQAFESALMSRKGD